MGQNKSTEERIREVASELFSLMKEERPSIFSQRGWKGRIMHWAMRDDSFKNQLLRFIDVLPSLKTDALVLRLFKEYFDEIPDAPVIVRRGIGRLSRANVVPRIIAPIIRASVKSFAREFIAGADPKDTHKSLSDLSASRQRISYLNARISCRQWALISRSIHRLSLSNSSSSGTDQPKASGLLN